MNYTTNYHLPQWVEADRIMMEDFNTAMANIDEGIQLAGRQECYTVGTNNKNVGDTVYTFPDFPRLVLLIGGNSGICLIKAGGTGYMMDDYSYNNEYSVYFRLNGKELILQDRTNNHAGGTLYILAFY